MTKMVFLLVAMTVGLRIYAADGDLSAWMQARSEIRPKFPNSYIAPKDGSKSMVRNSFSFEAEEDVARRSLPDSTAVRSWKRVVDVLGETLSVATIRPSDDVTWSFAVYNQLGNLVPYYWAGTGYPAVSGSDLFAKSVERAREILGTTLARSQMLVATDVLTKADAEIAMMDGTSVVVPFERAYFVFVDDRPGANWAHPCRYVFFNDDLTSFVVSYQAYAPRIRRISSGERLRLKAVEGAADVVPLKTIADKVYSAANAMTAGVTASQGDVSRSHFVLISGGADPVSNAIRFWADTAMLYSTFTRKYGVPKSQIHVLMSDGGDPAKDANLGDYANLALVDSPTDLDGDGEPDVDGAATWDNMNNLFTNTLPKTVTADSQVFVFIVSHGSSDGTAGVYNRSCFAYLYSAEYTTVFSDVALANMTKGLPCPVAFAIETCYSGGFIDDLTATSDRVVLTACDHYESSLGTGGHGRWGSAGIGSTSAYDTWAVALAAAVRGRWPASYNKTQYVFGFPWNDGAIADADADGDGCVDMEEAYEFALENDECRCQDPSHSSCHADDAYVEHPQFAESTPGLAKEMFFVKQAAPEQGLWYVSMDGDDANDGLSWGTAKRTIQSAFNVAEDGHTIIVGEGCYGVFSTYGMKAVTIRSANGAAKTFIDGSGSKHVTLGIAKRAILVGFTVTNGYDVASGGGVSGGILSNCVLRANRAEYSGGGAYTSILYNCVLADNRALRTYGGGASHCTLVNCTVVGNSASRGGGLGDCAAKNCIVWGNSSSNGENLYESGCSYTCSSPLPAGTGNICLDPAFVSAPTGDYRLGESSPCIDAGCEGEASGATDLDGRSRVVGRAVDMGAYEWQGAISPTSTEFPYKLVNGNAVITNYTGTSKDVVFPATLDGHPVTEIAEIAFYYGTYPFVNVTISEDIRKIGHAAFGYSSRLETFSIPSTLTTFGDSIGSEFLGCPAVRSVNVANGNPNYKSIDGVLYDKAGTTLIYCPASKNPNSAFVVPSTVTSIAKYAFNCSKFKTVTLPATITKIEEDVFSCAQNLTSMVVPSRVSSIGRWAFEFCYALTSVTIPPSVTSIGDYAFADCRALKTVYVSPGDAQRVASLYSFDSSVNFVETGTPTTSDFEGMEAGRPVTTGSCESLGDSGSCWFASDMSGNESVVCDYGSSDVPLTYSGACGQPGGLAGQGDRYMSLKTRLGSPLWRTVNPLAGTAVEPRTVGDVLTFDFLAILDPCDEMPPMWIAPFLSNGIPYAANAIRRGAGSVCQVDDKLAVYLLEDEEGGSVSLCVQAGARNATSGQIEERIFQYSPDGLDAEAWNRVTIKATTTAGCLRFLVYFNGELLSDEAYYAWPQSQGGLSISALGFAGSGCFDNIFVGAADPVFADDDPGPVWPDCVYTQTVAGIAWTYSVDASGDATLLGVSQSGRTLIVPETLAGHDVTAIGNKAFAGLGAETVIVPENIESVGANAFSSCTSLAQVDFEGEPPTGLGAAGFPSTTLVRYNDAYVEAWVKALADAGLTNVSSYHPLMDLDWEYESCEGGVRITGVRTWGRDIEPGEVRIPNSIWGNPVTEVGRGLGIGSFREYDNDFITAVTIPDGVHTIGDMAFESCGLLTTARLPDSVTRIGWLAFSGCTNLANIALPKRLRTIDMNAFHDCGSLSEISIPASVTNIGKTAFYHCMKLASFEVEAGNPSYVSIGGVLYDKDVRTLIQCPALVSSVEIPKTVTVIEMSAFFWCTKITSLHIPESVEEIGIFVGCDSLAELTVDAKSKCFSCYDGVIYDYGKKTLVCCPPTCKAVDIPQTVVRIDIGAFVGCSSLVEIILPTGLREIGENAFDECLSLESITIPSEVWNIPDETFYGCANLKEVKLLGAVTNISRRAFYRCRSLETMALPASVKHIGSDAFTGCESLALTFEGAPPQVDEDGWNGTFRDCKCGYYSGCRELWEETIDASGKWHELSMSYLPPADSGRVTFGQDTLSVEKGDVLRLVVYGCRGEKAASVKLGVAYGNAKAADLVLKKATVSGAKGVEKKNLKFPLTLSWAKGDSSPKTIEIPVAAGKATDAPKYLTWTLTNAKGVKTGEFTSCFATIGPGAKWNGKDVYVRPIVANGTGGKVSGAANVKPDKKGKYGTVTLKATANKGYWFTGWYDASGERVSGDLSFKYKPEGDERLAELEARFVPAQMSLCGTYRGCAQANMRGMKVVKGADTSSNVYGEYPVVVTLSSAGKISGSVTVAGKKVAFACNGPTEVEVGEDGVVRSNFAVKIDEKALFGRTNKETAVITLTDSSEGWSGMTVFSLSGDFAPLASAASFVPLALDRSKQASVKGKLATLAGKYAGYASDGKGHVVPLSIVVDAAGKAKIAGRFYDGTSLSASVVLGCYGEDADWTDPAEWWTRGDAFIPVKTLGGGNLHLRLCGYLSDGAGRPDLQIEGVDVTSYSPSLVAENPVRLDGSAVSRFSSKTWFPADADPVFGVVRLASGEDVVDILYSTKNGKITGLGKPLQSGMKVSFDVKTGLLIVAKGKSYTIQGVLGNYASGCYAAGRINAKKTSAPVSVEFVTLPEPEENFPWRDDEFELSVGQNFGSEMQPSVLAGGTPLALTISGLPAGLAYDKTTGRITGASTKAGTFAVKVSYTYAGRKVTRTVKLVVLPKPAGLPRGTYSGYASVCVDGENGNQTIECPFAATIDKNGALSGSMTLFGKKVPFKASGYDSSDCGVSEYTATMDLKAINKAWGSAKLAICWIDDKIFFDSVELFGDLYAVCDITAHRDQSKDADRASRVAPYVGTYVAALDTEFPQDSDIWRVTTLSVAVDKKGMVKLAGTFVDGTPYSASAPLAIVDDEDGTWAYVDVVVRPRALAQGGLKLSLEFGDAGIDDSGKRQVSFWCWSDAAKYVRSSLEYVAADLGVCFAYRYTSLAWSSPFIPPQETCLEVSCDNGSLGVAAFAWKSKTVSGEKRISGVGTRLSGPSMTFELDDKTGLFFGTCGGCKIFGVMEEGTCRGVGTVVGKDGCVDRVTVDVAER